VAHSNPDPRQIAQVNGQEVTLPAGVCKFDVGPDGIELTDEEVWWLLYGDAYQHPPATANSSLLSHGRGWIRRDCGCYEDLLCRFEELRAQTGTIALILTKDGYEERVYDGEKQYTLTYDASQKCLMIEAGGQTEVRPWNPPPRRAPGYRPVKMPDLERIKTITIV